MATQKFVNDSINDFQGAVKCAMAQLDNGNLTGYTFTLLTAFKNYLKSFNSL